MKPRLMKLRLLRRITMMMTFARNVARPVSVQAWCLPPLSL
jgi:hypothetical protein